MKPRSLSATAIQRYEQCPKGFIADLVSRVKVDSQPGLFGTALHATLDKYIEKLNIVPDVPAVHNPELLFMLWEAACVVYLGYGSDYQAEGRELLANWVTTRDLPHEVVSREMKRSFMVVPTDAAPGEEQKINYIIDRLDRHADGTIEVVDYKSQWEILSHEQMRHLIQPALYAVAVFREYDDDSVVVTFDFLRGRPVSVIYTRDQAAEIETYLSTITRTIWDDDNPVEKLNKGCRYCTRKGVCSTLIKAIEAGWSPAAPVDELVARRDDLNNAVKGLEALVKEIDESILEHLRQLDTPEFDTDTHVVRATRKNYTTYDTEVVLRVLGDDAIPYLSVAKTELDKELKRKKGRFDPEQAQAIWDMAITTQGRPTIKIEPKGGHEIE